MIEETVIAEYEPTPKVLYRAERFVGTGPFGRENWVPLRVTSSTNEEQEREAAKRAAQAGDRTRVVQITFSHGDPAVPEKRYEPKSVKEALETMGRTIKRPEDALDRQLSLEDLG